MSWNDKKFLSLRMGAKPEVWETSVLLSPDCSPIPSVEEVKDLGILIDRKASFKPQRAKVLRKVMARAGWVTRTFKSRELHLMKQLWVSLIRPLQDYGSQLWAPVGSGADLRAQEGPLRGFGRPITGTG